MRFKPVYLGPKKHKYGCNTGYIYDTSGTPEYNKF